MQRILVFTLTLFCSVVSAAPNLEGTWQSSLELSNEFNLANAQLNEKQKQFIKQTFGHMIIKYKSNSYTTSDKKRKILVNGEEHDWGGFNNVYKYKILARNDFKVVLEEVNEDNESSISILHFIDENTYWVYIGSSKNFGHLNIREYFVRVK